MSAGLWAHKTQGCTVIFIRKPSIRNSREPFEFNLSRDCSKFQVNSCNSIVEVVVVSLASASAEGDNLYPGDIILLQLLAELTFFLTATSTIDSKYQQCVGLPFSEKNFYCGTR